MDDEKKVIKVKLAMLDVTEVDSEKIIKKIGPFVEIYSKTFDGVKAELSKSVKEEVEKTFVVISGVRKEKEEERRARLGVNPDKGWVAEYAKLVCIPKKESEENLKEMMAEGLTLTPEEWLSHKKKKIEGFFNVK
jgi:hypothetical protein